MEKQADLREGFRARWVDISRKNPDGSHPECGRDEAKLGKKGYPKCRPKAKAAQMTKKEKSYAVRAKRSKRQGVGGKPTMVPTEKPDKQTKTAAMDKIAKNVPTDPAKWSQAKSQAKAKFDVYPSAYANGWAAKKYKAMGGSWKKEAGLSIMEKVAMNYSGISAASQAAKPVQAAAPAAKGMGQKLMQRGRIAGKKFKGMSTAKQLGTVGAVAGGAMLAKKLLSRPKPQPQNTTTVIKTADDHSIDMTEENNFAGIITDAFLTKIAAELDPVGQEDKDIDNDGDHDKSDKYLAKRRKAIGKAMSKRQMAKEAAMGADFKATDAGKGAAMSAIRGKSEEQKKRERRGLALALGAPAALIGGSFAYDALKKKAAACGSTDQPEHKRVPGKAKKKAPLQKEAKMQKAHKLEAKMHKMRAEEHSLAAKRIQPSMLTRLMGGDGPERRNRLKDKETEARAKADNFEAKMKAFNAARDLKKAKMRGRNFEMNKAASDCGSHGSAPKKKAKKKGAAPKAGY